MKEKREYRVVCTHEKNSDNIFVDIAPVQGVTHDMLYYSRLQYQHSLHNQKLEDYGTNSIFMSVSGNGEPVIDFSQGTQAPKDSPEYEAHMKLCEKVRPLIIETYHRMITHGSEQTLAYILSPVEAGLYKESLQKESLSAERLMEKSREELKKPVSSPEEEKAAQTKASFYEQQARRRNAAYMQAIIRARRGRISYDGD